MDILSALTSEASKLQKQLNVINSAIEILGGKNRPRSRQETALACKRESQNSEGAKGAVGEDKNEEEECLRTIQLAHLQPDLTRG